MGMQRFSMCGCVYPLVRTLARADLGLREVVGASWIG